MALDPREIWYGIDGERYGPVDVDTLRQLLAAGTLRPRDYLWDDDLEDWVPVHQYPFLLQGDSRAVPPVTGDEAPPTEPVSGLHPAYREPRPVHYASFWLRLVAWLIDTAILMVPAYLWVSYVEQRTGVSMEEYMKALASAQPLGESVSRFVQMVELGMLVVRWLYEAGLESSVWQGTVGKHVLGLVVTDEAGRRIHFGRATLRYVGKFVSQLTLFLGYAMILVTERRQALHDKIARTLVVQR